MRKQVIPLFGHETPVTEVEITSKPKESVGEYVLEDGSIIRFAAVPTAVYRIDGQYNADGNPVYLVLHGTVVTPLHTPTELRKK